jgi:RsiW-degrading membrane proteinase PrsW (M82 family)
MSQLLLIETAIALLPVLGFLVVLHLFDSYRLASLFEIAQMIVAGVVLATAAYYLNGFLLAATDADYGAYSHFAGPAVEETLKALAILVLFWRNRIGFVIDAIIVGFAVGTGFALFENVFYLYAFHDASIGDWIIRGFGTAIMHGGTTAIFAAIGQSWIEKRGRFSILLFVPALFVAIILHAVYNYLQGMPLVATLAALFGLPPLFYLIFTKNEHAVHQWLVDDYASHELLLAEIESGRFAHSEAGRFIQTLAARFDKATVEQIFAYLKLHAQLVLRAEKRELAREKGETIPPDPQDRADLHRLAALEKEIGAAAMMTLWPHLHFSRRELWELHELIEG